MDEGLKKRLVGAAVLASLVVIFVPMLLDREPVLEQGLQRTNIPPRPEKAFSSRVLPSESEPLSTPPAEVLSPPVAGAPPARVEDAAPPASTPPGPAAQEPKKPVKPAPPAQRPALASWVIQVASFSSQDNAENLTQKLRDEKFDAFVEPAQVKGKRVYRVRVGPEIDRRQADATLQQVNRVLKSQNLKATLTTYP